MKKVAWSSILVVAVLLAVGVIADAQQPTKIPRIGYLIGTSPTANAARVEAFRQGLRELGYVEGKTIVIEWRWAEGKPDRLPDLAAELVRLRSTSSSPPDRRSPIRSRKRPKRFPLS